MNARQIGRRELRIGTAEDGAGFFGRGLVEEVAGFEKLFGRDADECGVFSTGKSACATKTGFALRFQEGYPATGAADSSRSESFS